LLDTDGDNVLGIYDLDDDNDGVLDADENGTTGEVNYTTTYTVYALANNLKFSTFPAITYTKCVCWCLYPLFCV
jgi:hypothetical protein